MIDVSKLSYQEVQNLKKQIEEYDKGLRGYKVQFTVLYNPKGREEQDISSDDAFLFWLEDVIPGEIEKSFDFKSPETVIMDYVVEMTDDEITSMIDE